MQTLTQIFAAPGTWDLASPMRYFRLLSASAAVTVRVFAAGREVERAENVQAGYWFKWDQPFDRLSIDCGAGSYTIALADNQNGGYDRLAGDVGATIKTALSIVNRSFVNVAQVETALTTLNAGRAGLRFWNTSDANIYLGAPGLLVADAAIKLAPGEFWDEACAPGAVWVAIADGTGNKPLKIQELYY